MRRRTKTLLVVFLAIGATLGLCMPAQAYVDPNAGGLLFQLLTPIIALMAAGMTFARRQLLRLWDCMLTVMKTLATRLFKT
jgi:hypothetical protein